MQMVVDSAGLNSAPWTLLGDSRVHRDWQEAVGCRGFGNFSPQVRGRLRLSSRSCVIWLKAACKPIMARAKWLTFGSTTTTAPWPLPRLWKCLSRFSVKPEKIRSWFRLLGQNLHPDVSQKGILQIVSTDLLVCVSLMSDHCRSKLG